MKRKLPGPAQGEADAERQRLLRIRDGVLNLHKVLIESERVTYESTVGAIRSSNEFLDLVIRDPWFAWLHPISQLIVSMDEALDSKEGLGRAEVEALRTRAKQLLVPSEEGEGYSKHYFDALQRDPDVIFAHRETTKALE